MPRLGDNVRALRERQGISRPQLAAAVGVSYTFIQQLESGAGKEPGAAKLHKIAQTLGVTVDDLLTRSYVTADPATGGDSASPVSSPQRRQLQVLIDNATDEQIAELLILSKSVLKLMDSAATVQH